MSANDPEPITGSMTTQFRTLLINVSKDVFFDDRLTKPVCLVPLSKFT
jgi:hypothetical protein